MVRIPALDWQNMLSAWRNEDERKLIAAAMTANDAKTEHASSVVTLTDASLTLDLSEGHVARVQLASELVGGVLTPVVQLFSAHPGLDICVQHRRDPAASFLPVASQLDAPAQFNFDTADYEQRWQRCLALESVATALRDVTPTVVSGVDVNWFHETDGACVAQVELPLDFAIQNKFTFALDTHLLLSLANGHVFDYLSNQERAYVCVRHSNIDVTTSSDVSGRGTFTWVGHCVLSKVVVSPQRGLELTLNLVSSCVPPPDALFSGTGLSASVEFIEKPELFR